jgi:hypothetical protein
MTKDEKSVLEREHKLHLCGAEKATICMKGDKENAIANPENYFCSIDLQKSLPFPVFTMSNAYYKRNLFCYNLGVYNFVNDSSIYVWQEAISSRGSQKVSSCLVKHIKLQTSDKDISQCMVIHVLVKT